MAVAARRGGQGGAARAHHGAVRAPGGCARWRRRPRRRCSGCSTARHALAPALLLVTRDLVATTAEAGPRRRRSRRRWTGCSSAGRTDRPREVEDAVWRREAGLLHRLRPRLRDPSLQDRRRPGQLGLRSQAAAPHRVGVARRQTGARGDPARHPRIQRGGRAHEDPRHTRPPPDARRLQGSGSTRRTTPTRCAPSCPTPSAPDTLPPTVARPQSKPRKVTKGTKGDHAALRRCSVHGMQRSSAPWFDPSTGSGVAPSIVEGRQAHHGAREGCTPSETRR